jgi:hypothetical protein
MAHWRLAVVFVRESTHSRHPGIGGSAEISGIQTPRRGILKNQSPTDAVSVDEARPLATRRSRLAYRRPG